tara:strand:- start:313 stop:552 length:240 start_codon:yes stop_codon:yes gene_type:complete
MRLDKINNKKLSVSIAVKEKFQRKGYGKIMLNKILNKKKISQYTVWAYVKSKNLSSKNFFFNLGFKLIKNKQFMKKAKI